MQQNAKRGIAVGGGERPRLQFADNSGDWSANIGVIADGNGLSGGDNFSGGNLRLRVRQRNRQQRGRGHVKNGGVGIHNGYFPFFHSREGGNREIPAFAGMERGAGMGGRGGKIKGSGRRLGRGRLGLVAATERIPEPPNLSAGGECRGGWRGDAPTW